MMRSLTGIATATAVIGAMMIGTTAAQAEETDTTPPTVSIVSPVENQQVPIGVQPLPTVQYACDDDVSVATCDASIGPLNGQNPPLTVGNGMPLDLLNPGLYVLRVTSTDTAGNPAESAVQFEMVGDEPRDETAPSIQISAPVDGAQVRKGASLTATYLCQDAESGIESCEGTVASGEAIDTSTLGLKDFTVVARDKAGNESSETVQYEVIAPASVTVSGTIKDVQGNVVPESTVEARLAGTSEVVASTEANTDGVYSLTLPEGTYDLKYRGPEGSGIGANLDGRDLTQDREINVTLGPVGITLSGVLGDGSEPVEYGVVYVNDANWATITSIPVPADGAWTVELAPGNYILRSITRTASAYVSQDLTARSYTTENPTVDLNPRRSPVTINLLGADGQPAAGTAKLECNTYSPDTGNTYLYTSTTGSGTLTLSGIPTPEDQTCGISVDPDDGPIITRRINIPTEGTAVDLTVEPGITLSGVLGDGSEPVEYGVVYVNDANWATITSIPVPADGAWTVELAPGNYILRSITRTASAYVSQDLTARSYTTENTTVDLNPRRSPVTINLLGADGQPAAGTAKLECNTYSPDTGNTYLYTSTTGSGTLTLSGIPTPEDQTCGISVDPDDGPIITRRINIPTEGTAVDLTVEPGITLSGVLGDGSEPVEYGVVYVNDANWATITSIPVPADGAWTVELAPGNYILRSITRTASAYVSQDLTARSYTTENTTVDLNPRRSPVTINLLGADGQPAAGTAKLECNTYSPDTGNTYLYTSTTGSGTLTLSGIPTPEDQTCGISVDPDDGPIITRRINIPTEGTTLTFFTFGAGIEGDTDTTNDGDNVADAVEALAPNNGDGNNDGTPDYEQQNVTSLPVNGSGLGEGANYVTVAAPAGTELSNVFTIDPTDTTKVETPPPPGVTLPEGLTNLVLKGVESGTDQTISIFTSSTQDVTGYAKYDPNTKQWSLLPDDRVKILDNRVEITLTDGGIGDDDRLANGRISDPGGIAIVKNLDTLAPTVTGTATSQPNANGWYNDDVTVKWTANDPEPSSGLSGDPANTVIDGEGDDLSAESAQACDTAGNCSTGSVTGIKIDRTKPSVAITGIKDGATYTLGAAPTAACSATDGLSGVDGECVGTSTGGNANGVGTFTYTARATDLAGNVRTATASYQVVYRFDGFMQPINDPALVPSAARSVFKSGSNVPVKFQVKRADGTLIDPITAPEWLIPEKGAATAATVNEATWSEPATSGTQFEKTLNQWQYNWKTKGVAAGYTYRIGVRLDDGTKHYVVVASK